MIITEQKLFERIVDSLNNRNRIFLVGCGECATTCKTGGEPQIAQMKAKLEAAGKTVTGTAIPQAPCMSPQIKQELAKNMKALRESEVILVLACGLGTQSVKDNLRLELDTIPGCNTLGAVVMDAQGNFVEKCSLCADCVLDLTAGICPVTLCAKGLLNGPCGGMNKGKCEVDKEKDCAWVLIYNQMQKTNRLQGLKAIIGPKDHKKNLKPRKIAAAS